ncbi:hypothetical protein L2E82_48986 [Cichorium intybus]|uniref:Uncharacterized protein n=1 Tax=Cichorium intybus TaxID=13427 RepID=A0ACB8YYF6_CICIN|nr:hypothetical protein L2E82_48986 [Cichorium intybus]
MPSFSQSSNHNISPSFSVFKPPQICAIWRYQVEAVLLGLMEGVESKDWLKGLMEGLESKDWLMVYDSLNDVRRMTLYHSTLLLPIFFIFSVVKLVTLNDIRIITVVLPSPKHAQLSWNVLQQELVLIQVVKSTFWIDFALLYRAYQRLYASMHDKGVGPHKTQFRRDDNYGFNYLFLLDYVKGKSGKKMEAFDSLLQKLHKYVPLGASVTDLYAGAGVIGLSLASTGKCRKELFIFCSDCLKV